MVKKDVVIATNSVLSREQIALLPSEPPPREHFQLADDLWAGKLDSTTAERVLDGCEPPGCWVKKPPRLYSQLYAFIREPAPTVPSYTWDSDLRLQTCIALSRLIQPTSIGFEHAAQITYNPDGSVSEIIPGPIKGFGAEAYVANKNGRNWLTLNDLNVLKALLRHLPLSNLPQRVQRALWTHEYAARTFHASVRWTLISTALEALIHTDRLQSTLQFKKRVSLLASELGTCKFDETDADTAYDRRSRIAHGQGIASLDVKDLDLYRRMEKVLQQALVRAITDPNFAKVFATDEGIRTRWPLSDSKKREMGSKERNGVRHEC